MSGPRRWPARRSPYDRDIRRLAIPALATLAIEPLYVLVDTAIVGRIGTDELAGLAIAAVVLTGVFGICNFLAYATTAAVARRVGAGDRRGAAAQGMDALWLALGLGLVLTALGLALAPTVVDAMGASASVRAPALTYLRISLLASPAMLVGLAGMGYLRGWQDTRTPLVVALGANAVNLVVELVLVFGLGYGIAGSAWSTVGAQTGAAIVFAGFVLRAVAREGARLRPDPAGIRRAATVGAHLVVRTGALLAAFLLATAVASRIGDAEVAAHQIAFQVWLFLALTLDAIAIAAQALIGRFLGADHPADAQGSARRMLEWGVVAGVVVGLALALLAPALAAVFTDDPAVRDLATTALLAVALLQPLNAVVFVLDGVLIGAGETRYLAGAMVAALVVYLPALAVVATAGGGLLALWGALSLWMAARAVGMAARYRSRRWLVTGAPPS